MASFSKKGGVRPVATSTRESAWTIPFCASVDSFFSVSFVTAFFFAGFLSICSPAAAALSFFASVGWVRVLTICFTGLFICSVFAFSSDSREPNTIFIPSDTCDRTAILSFVTSILGGLPSSIIATSASSELICISSPF